MFIIILVIGLSCDLQYLFWTHWPICFKFSLKWYRAYLLYVKLSENTYDHKQNGGKLDLYDLFLLYFLNPLTDFGHIFTDLMQYFSFMHWIARKHFWLKTRWRQTWPNYSFLLYFQKPIDRFASYFYQIITIFVL